MNVSPVQTRLFRPPRDDLWQLLATSLPALEERTVVAVASKVVAIGEGRCVPVDAVPDKDALIIREADWYLERDLVPQRWVLPTLTHGVLIPSAGVDESNGAGHYILWPADPAASARGIWRFLRRQFGLRHVGVLVTDSRSVPLRRGLVGFALAACGFRPLRDYRRRRDLFGRPLRVSQTNLADGLAAAAVLAMGEGNERTPLAVLTDVPGIRFVSQVPRTRGRVGANDTLEVPIEEDLYRPFLAHVPWKAGGILRHR